jgi:hypothetical protein
MWLGGGPRVWIVELMFREVVASVRGGWEWVAGRAQGGGRAGLPEAWWADLATMGLSVPALQQEA